MNTKKILGIVAVLALVAVAFVGAGAADTTAYYVADDGIDSATSTVDQPMSTTYFFTNKASSLDSNCVVYVPSSKTMTIPNGKTLKLNGAELNISGTVNLNGVLETTTLAKIAGTDYMINIVNGSEFNVTADPTNDLTNVKKKFGTAMTGAVIYVKPSTSVAGAKWVVTKDTTGANMNDSTGSSANVSRTNLDPSSNSTIVGYDNPVTYTVTIPESVTLKTTGPADVDYKVTIGTAGAATDERAVVLKLASSENLKDNTLYVKNMYGSDTVAYHMVVMDATPGVTDIKAVDSPITAIMVNGSQATYGGKTWQSPSEKTVTANVNFAGDAAGTKGVTFDYAGNYQDTLTFSVGLEDTTDTVELAFGTESGGSHGAVTWTLNGSDVPSTVSIPKNSVISYAAFTTADGVHTANGVDVVINGVTYTATMVSSKYYLELITLGSGTSATTGEAITSGSTKITAASTLLACGGPE